MCTQGPRSFWSAFHALAAVVCGLAGILAVTTQARANVYAAHLQPAGTSWDFSQSGAMNISYRLNHAATSVTVEVFRLSEPATVIKTITGGTAYGLNTVSWDGTDNSNTPVTGAGDYSFRVIAADSVGYTSWTNITPTSGGNEIGDAQYYAAQGVAVNREPTSAHFGRIYIGSSYTDATSANPGATAVGDGLFLLNSDMTFRDGSAATAAAAANAQLITNGTSTSSPWKININQNNPDEIVVTDFVDGFENVWIFNADGTSVSRILNSSTTGPTGTFTHGNAISAALTGTGADRKLWIIDEDKDVGAARLAGGYDIVRFDIGTTLEDFAGQGVEVKNGGGPNFNAQIFYTGRDMQFGRVSGLSRIYVATRRANNSTTNMAVTCYTLDASGVVNGTLWTQTTGSLSTATGAVFIYPNCVAVDEVHGRVAVARDVNSNNNLGRVVILNSETGAYITTFETGAYSVRDLDFDAAGNLYSANQTDEHIRMWSPPDGPNSYTTPYYGVLAINCGSPPPTINTQPTGASVCPGDPVTLTVDADGHGVPLLYQWKRGSVSVGTSSPTLTIPSAALSDAGSYTCTVTGCGTAVTTPVFVTVGATVTAHPVNQTNKCQGDTATFSITAATGAPPLTYTWYKGTQALSDGVDLNGVVISGAQTPTLTLSNLSTADNNAVFSCKVTDQCASGTSATSNTAKLVFTNIPVITAQPVSTGVYPGQTANFSVTATDSLSGTLNYQWRKNGADIPGATASTLAIIAGGTDAGADIDVVVSNTCGPQKSAVRKLNVAALPCSLTWADADGDSDVDMDDFGVFQGCFTGSAAGYDFAGYCGCFDRAGGAGVDLADFAAFAQCATGASVPAAVGCGGNIVFTDNFEADSTANWTLLASSTNHAMALNYDYSAQGIPAAPSGSGTKGLKANVNLGAGTELIAGIAYSTASYTGDYTVYFDMWSNWGASEAGTTTQALFGVNGDGTSIQAPTAIVVAPGTGPVLSGYLFGATVDGQGSQSRDYLAWEGATELVPAEAGWANMTANGDLAPFSDIFPAPKAVASGATGNGGGTGWGWVRVQITNNATAGTVSVKLNGRQVLTRSAATYPSGRLMLGVMDTFASSKMSANMYTVFDNVMVTVP